MKTLYAIILIAFMVSCDNHKAQEGEDPLKTEVLAIHDEAMEKMDLLMSLQMQLLKNKDSTNAGQFEEAAKGLDEAHEKMMDWMYNFSNQFPHAVLKGGHHDNHNNHNNHDNHDDHSDMGHNGQETSAGIKPENEAELLKEEKEKVIALRDEMDRRIESAKELLRDHGNSASN